MKNLGMILLAWILMVGSASSVLFGMYELLIEMSK
jgi:hypothetical protein